MEISHHLSVSALIVLLKRMEFNCYNRLSGKTKRGMKACQMCRTSMSGDGLATKDEIASFTPEEWLKLG